MNKKCNQCNLCEAVGYSKKATNRIQIIGGEKGDTIRYLCKSRTKPFDDPLGCNTNKKTLEQAVQPERSNVHHIRPYQQPGASLDD